MSYDVIIAGLGVMGSSIALHAARRGMRVLGVDRYRPPHLMGSSHGNTRLIREAYYEDPRYVPMVRRSYELWRDLEAELGQPLLTRAGSLMIGGPDTELVRGTIRSAIEHGVGHEVLSAEEVTRHFPGFEPEESMVGVHEPGSSLLQPETIVAGQLRLAEQSGAEIRYDCRLMSWHSTDSGVSVSLEGSQENCGQLVLSTGAWNPGLAPRPLASLVVERQLQQWWTPARNPNWFTVGSLPVSMWQLADSRIFYTMPDTGLGLKLGWHHSGPAVDPDTVDRQAGAAENAALTDLLRRFMPAAKGMRRDSVVCLYTNTPDGHFLIDRHPDASNVWLVSPCSGHGFKFGSVIGELMGAQLTGARPSFDLSPFRWPRLT